MFIVNVLDVNWKAGSDFLQKYRALVTHCHQLRTPARMTVYSPQLEPRR